MEQLESLSISENDALTQQGIITLAREIGVRGLPMLYRFFMEELREMKAVGIGAMAHAVIKGCPRLKVIEFAGSSPGYGSHRDTVTGTLDAVGRVVKVKVIYDKEA